MDVIPVLWESPTHVLYQDPFFPTESQSQEFDTLLKWYLSGYNLHLISNFCKHNVFTQLFPGRSSKTLCLYITKNKFRIYLVNNHDPSSDTFSNSMKANSIVMESWLIISLFPVGIVLGWGERQM